MGARAEIECFSVTSYAQRCSSGGEVSHWLIDRRRHPASDSPRSVAHCSGQRYSPWFRVDPPVAQTSGFATNRAALLYGHSCVAKRYCIIASTGNTVVQCRSATPSMSPPADRRAHQATCGRLLRRPHAHHPQRNPNVHLRSPHRRSGAPSMLAQTTGYTKAHCGNSARS
jgi:hypothetical protein